MELSELKSMAVRAAGAAFKDAPPSSYMLGCVEAVEVCPQMLSVLVNSPDHKANWNNSFDLGTSPPGSVVESMLPLAAAFVDELSYANGSSEEAVRALANSQALGAWAVVTGQVGKYEDKKGPSGPPIRLY